jgi:DNA-binding NarL/FixJ family response regulator
VSIKLLLADDHPVVREGIRLAIERAAADIEIVSEASNGKEVLEFARKNPVDVYILDISMPILNGIETTVKLIKMNPNNRIIILSIHDSRSFVEKALYCGARGYLLKVNAVDDVIHAIHEVHRGRFFLSSSISKYIVNGFLSDLHKREINENLVHLTEREREVLQLIAEGFTNKEIASNLNLALNTVHVHRKNIMQKLDIHKHAGLIRYAIKEGIIKL